MSLFFTLWASNAVFSQGFACTVSGESSWQRASNCNQFDLTTEEILCLPDITFKLAFHFEEDALGNNFICDPNDPLVISQPWTSWYAPNLVDNIINRLNLNMSHALLLNGGEEDAKIKFETYGTGSCGDDIFIYPYVNGSATGFVPVAGAFNVYCISDDINDTSLSGFAFFNSSAVTLENIINNWVSGANDTWNVADLLGHEWGHSRNLHHTFYVGNPCNNINPDGDLDCAAECSGTCYSTPNPPSNNNCFGSSANNLMMSNGHNISNLTECEFGEIWNYFINNDESFQTFELCDLPENNEKIIYDENTSITWDSKKMFTKHVLIKSGTTVTVNCEVQMGDDKEIVVEEGAKLIVEGGTITSICEKPWRGIKVYGGSDSYAVEIKDGSTIENTSQGAVSMFHDGGWLLGDGNAHVLIEGSTFNDCNRILGMGSIIHNVNLSKVEGNVQNGGKYGITNWNCLNVSILDNTFNDIEKTCIVSSGQAFIEGNTFRGFESDILFPSVNPTISSIIEDNDFHGTQGGIVMLGAGIADHLIQLNRFHSSIVNIWMEGDNHYSIIDNTIRGQIGGVFIHNGEHFNEVVDNDISTNNVGLRMFGGNFGFVINRNCYQTVEVDNYITGSIGTVQGAISGSGPSFRPANNCFTHGGSISSPVEDLHGAPNDFLYIEPDDGNLDCRDAVKAEPNIQIEEFGNVRGNPCNYQDDDGGIDDPCNPIRDLARVEQSLNRLESVISGLSESSAEYELYQRCYESVRRLRIELMLNQEDYSLIRTALGDVPLDNAKLLMYKTYLAENDYENAREYLLSLTNNSEQLDDFVKIQLIEIKRLSSNLEYQVSHTELQEILLIASKGHAYTAYAKSLYYWLTGELITTNLPPIVLNNETQERNLISENENERLYLDVYPNPFNDNLNIGFSQDFEKESKIVIEDILGRQIIKYSTNSSYSNLNTSNWNEGIYMVRIYNEGNLIGTKKLLLAR